MKSQLQAHPESWDNNRAFDLAAMVVGGLVAGLMLFLSGWPYRLVEPKLEQQIGIGAGSLRNTPTPPTIRLRIGLPVAHDHSSRSALDSLSGPCRTRNHVRPMTSSLRTIASLHSRPFVVTTSHPRAKITVRKNSVTSLNSQGQATA